MKSSSLPKNDRLQGAVPTFSVSSSRDLLGYMYVKKAAWKRSSLFAECSLHIISVVYTNLEAIPEEGVGTIERALDILSLFLASRVKMVPFK